MSTHPPTHDRRADRRTADPRHRSPKPSRPWSRASSSAKRTCARAPTSRDSVRARGLDDSRRRHRQHLRALARQRPELAPIGTGSHIDAIPNAGLYDGCVGVLGGLEAIRVLQKLGFKPRRSIELVIFTAEEPTRFGIGCLGSRMMAGVLTPQQALALRDKEGRGLDELRTAGRIHRPARIRRAAQGPLPPVRRTAHRAGTAISNRKASTSAWSRTSPRRPAMRIVIEGEGGHAGGKADARPQRCAGGRGRADPRA